MTAQIIPFDYPTKAKQIPLHEIYWSLAKEFSDAAFDFQRKGWGDCFDTSLAIFGLLTDLSNQVKGKSPPPTHDGDDAA